jgi:nitrogen-specific signal transduction histidine kinase
MAYGRAEAFDENDARLMTTLADFAAVGYRQQKQRAQFIKQWQSRSMASHLAHEINNPLQSMTNAAFLIAEGKPDCDSKVLGRGPLLATI